ncbi:hypothetical protein MHZ93_24440 [Roseomonas sp. ACRSG]|nr:hypothetical protein [Roseomonas sp. ACRSG]
MPVRITVELFPTANLFKAGHRIRLDIASSELPHYATPRPGSPRAPAGGCGWRRTRSFRGCGAAFPAGAATGQVRR